MRDETAFVIGAPAEDDLLAMEALYVISLKRNEKGFIQDLRYHGDIKDYARARMADGVFAVGKLDGKVVAMGALRPTDDGTALEVGKLHVEAGLQGQGLGWKMLGYLEEQARAKRVKKLVLHVTTSQQKAISLYRRNGFEDMNVEVWHGDVFGTPVAFETLDMVKVLD